MLSQQQDIQLFSNWKKTGALFTILFRHLCIRSLICVSVLNFNEICHHASSDSLFFCRNMMVSGIYSIECSGLQQLNKKFDKIYFNVCTFFRYIDTSEIGW